MTEHLWTFRFEDKESADAAYRILRQDGHDIRRGNRPTESIVFFDDTTTLSMVEHIRGDYDDMNFEIIKPLDYEYLYRDYFHFYPKFNLSHLYPSGLYSDVTIMADGHEFKVHKAILSSCSDYFKAMFKFNQLDVYEIHEVSAEGLDEVFNFIYNGMRKDKLKPNILEVLFYLRRFDVKGINYYDIINNTLFEHKYDEIYLVDVMNRIFGDPWPENLISMVYYTGVNPDLFPPRTKEIFQTMHL